MSLDTERSNDFFPNLKTVMTQKHVSKTNLCIALFLTRIS